MESNIIEKEIWKLIIKYVKDIENINMKSAMDLVEDLNLNSLELITLIVEIENCFSIDFDDHNENMSDLTNISYLIEKVIDFTESKDDVHDSGI